MQKFKILLAEDDPNFGLVLKDYLMLNGYDVTLCVDGVDALTEFKRTRYDLCISDVMMPRKDGFTMAAEIKKANPKQPIIFLTAKTMKDDVLQGYKTGADDYIVKPFDSEVLLYKIKAVLSRNNSYDGETERLINIGHFVFDTLERTLTINGTSAKMSPKEADLLKMLCSSEGQIIERQKLLLKVWGDDSYHNSRSMDVYVTKLRKYLKDDPRIEIENLHATGFKLHVRE